MQQGSSHSEATKAKIGEGVRAARARWQAKRERDSLVVYSIDAALEALELADHRIAKVRRLKLVFPGSLEYDEYMAAERATEDAITALTTAAGVIRHAAEPENPA